MYILFSTSRCPNCPRAKQLVADKGILVDLIDASTPDGLDYAREYNVSQVPTLIEVDPEGGELSRMAGIDEIVNALDA